MIDYQKLHQRKHDMARRIRAALYRIRKRNIGRLDQRVLEQLAGAVNPIIAYHGDRDTFLPHGRPLRSRTQHASKTAILIREAHRAVVLYWDLIRMDETIGLDRLVGRLEFYAESGTKDCEILGGSKSGYTLLLPPRK